MNVILWSLCQQGLPPFPLKNDYFFRKVSSLSSVSLNNIIEQFNIVTSSQVTRKLFPILNQFDPEDCSSTAYYQLDLLENTIFSAIVQCFTDKLDHRLGRAIHKQQRQEAALKMLAMSNKWQSEMLKLKDLIQSQL